LIERNMNSSAAEIAHHHRRHSHHGSGKHHSSRRKRTKKILRRLAILGFILIVMLAFLYVWFSSGSSEGTSQLRQSPLVQVANMRTQPADDFAYSSLFAFAAGHVSPPLSHRFLPAR
jgi:hypothetical protein